MSRTHYVSGSSWETQVAYSRAVKVGSHIYVSGTTAINLLVEIDAEAYQIENPPEC